MSTPFFIDVPTNSDGFIPVDGSYEAIIDIPGGKVAKKIYLEKYCLLFSTASTNIAPAYGMILMRLETGSGDIRPPGISMGRSTTAGNAVNHSGWLPLMIVESQAQQLHRETQPQLIFLASHGKGADKFKLRLRLGEYYQSVVTGAGSTVKLTQLQMWMTLE